MLRRGTGKSKPYTLTLLTGGVLCTLDGKRVHPMNRRGRLEDGNRGVSFPHLS